MHKAKMVLLLLVALGAAGSAWNGEVHDDPHLLRVLPGAQRECKAGEDATCSAVVDFLTDWIGWMHPGLDRNRKPNVVKAARDFFSTSCAQEQARGCRYLGDMLSSPRWGQKQDLKAARTAWQRACDHKDAVGCARVEMLDAIDTGDAAKACDAGHGESCLVLALQAEPAPPGSTSSSPALQRHQQACDAGVSFSCSSLWRLQLRFDLELTAPITIGEPMGWPKHDVTTWVDDKFLAGLCQKQKLAAACAAPCTIVKMGPTASTDEKQCLPFCRQGVGPCAGGSPWVEAGCEAGSAASCFASADLADQRNDWSAYASFAQRMCALAPERCTDRVAELLLRPHAPPTTKVLLDLLEERCLKAQEAHACTRAALPYLTGNAIDVDKQKAKALLQEGCKLGECQKKLLEEAEKK